MMNGNVDPETLRFSPTSWNARANRDMAAAGIDYRPGPPVHVGSLHWAFAWPRFSVTPSPHVVSRFTT